MGAAATREKRDDVDPTAEPDRGGVDKSEKTLKVWDVATGKCVATLEGHSDPVRRAASAVCGTL